LKKKEQGHSWPQQTSHDPPEKGAGGHAGQAGDDPSESEGRAAGAGQGQSQAMVD